MERAKDMIGLESSKRAVDEQRAGEQETEQVRESGSAGHGVAHRRIADAPHAVGLLRGEARARLLEDAVRARKTRAQHVRAPCKHIHVQGRGITVEREGIR